MDTDDLSEEVYKGIIIKSDLFHHDLALQFGVLSSNCINESEYLEKSLLMITEWESDIELAIDEIFFDNHPQIKRFKSVLKEIKESIKEVQEIPIGKRTYEKW